MFNDLDESTCTCPSFLEQYICKHILGLKIKLKLISVLPAIKSVPLGQKKKPGRPT